MRTRSLLTFILLFAILEEGCENAHNTIREVQPSDPALARLVQASRKLPVPIFEERAANPVVRESDGKTCTTISYHAASGTDELAAYGDRAGLIYAGAFVEGAPLNRGEIVPIPVARRPIRIFLSTIGVNAVVGKAPTILTDVESPSPATIEQARVSLISNVLNAKGTVPGVINHQVRTFSSLSEALFEMGASASFLTNSIKVAMQSASYETHSNVLVDFTQIYYTLNVDPPLLPETPASWIAPGVTPEMLNPYTDSASNPILYVRSVGYGRHAYLLASSDADESELKASFDAAMNLIVSASGSLSDQQRTIVQSSSVNLLIVGGPADSVVLSKVTGGNLEGIEAYVAAGGKPTAASLGVPITYKFAYLSDATPAEISIAADFERRQCSTIPYLSDVQITFLTDDQDKDHDTDVDATIYNPNTGVTYFQWRLGKDEEYQVGSSHGPYGFALSNMLYLRDVASARLRVCFNPIGNDTWFFHIELKGTKSSGGAYIFNRSQLTLPNTVYSAAEGETGYCRVMHLSSAI